MQVQCAVVVVVGCGGMLNFFPESLGAVGKTLSALHRPVSVLSGHQLAPCRFPGFPGDVLSGFLDAVFSCAAVWWLLYTLLVHLPDEHVEGGPGLALFHGRLIYSFRRLFCETQETVIVQEIVLKENLGHTASVLPARLFPSRRLQFNMRIRIGGHGISQRI